ncbi:beta-galactosidase [Candidatus Saccharibacteria bacterium]|nr:beta-galactosidase [Candidatus Saccharibacteria bacterium]
MSHKPTRLLNPFTDLFNKTRNWINSSKLHKAVWLVSLTLVICIMFMYSVSQWYMFKHRHQPIEMGVTFIPKYARYYDLDPKETLQAIFDDLNFKYVRLVSYWSEGEAEQGKYDFSQLDWQFDMAKSRGVKVSLSIGLRQPRWPECHMPTWAEKMQKSEWEPKLKDYISAVVNRYKDNPALGSYQLENEYFLKAFGICPDFTRQRLVDEYNLVKTIDTEHPVIVSMSNNAIGTPIYAPTPDYWAISVYKRVWDKSVTKRYFEYPIPAWYYAFRAGWTEATRGRDSFIHELQAEAWTPNDLGIKETPLSEQDKSMNAERLHDRFEYGRATGMKKVDLWGAEWWYWRKVKRNDPSLWQAAKEEVEKTNLVNEKILRH